MENEDDIERSTTPDRDPEEENSESPTMIHEQIPTSSQETPTSATDQPSSSKATQSSSSLEYAVTQARSHKLLSTIGAIVLLGAISTIGYFAFFPGGGNDPIDSIAVMPFTSTNNDPDTQYLSDGLTESIIYNLSKLPQLKVLPTSTVFRYKGKEKTAEALGNELGVRAVLFSRITQRGDDLKISTELIDTKQNKVIWGEQYTRKVNDALSIQKEISKEISDRLQLKLTGEDEKKLTKTYTINPEAYQAYLKGRFHWNKRGKEDIKKAIEFFKEAIEIDPNYSLAWSGLADSYTLLTYNLGTPAKETMQKARSAAEKAIALDPDLAEAHTSLAAILNLFHRDSAGAEKEFQTAIRLNPKYATAHQWYGTLLGSIGKPDDAIREVKVAQQLEPLSFAINRSFGEFLFFTRRFDEATKQYKNSFFFIYDVVPIIIFYVFQPKRCLG